MTTITRNLPWFIRDLGVSVVGQVLLLLLESLKSNILYPEMLYLSN
jgi:hypothetical protein